MPSSDVKVAVLGASGHVGATFVEHSLEREPGYEVRPFIHSTGNAWRVLRRGDVEPVSVDVLDERALSTAIEGCTHVVNCTRGKPSVMVKGMNVLLKVCASKGIERLVHLSSVAVYGTTPDVQSQHEDAKTDAEGGYAAAKLKQDEMIEKAARRGLRSVVLCIPTVTGRYAPYNGFVIDAMRKGTLALVDGGKLPLDCCDAKNVAVAIEKALTCAQADGRRIFITDGGEPDWNDLVAGLSPLAPDHPPLDDLARRDALAIVSGDGGGRISAYKQAAGQFVKLQEVKEIVKRNVTLHQDYDKAMERYDRMPGWMRRRFDALVMPKETSDASPTRDYALNFIATQLRNVRRSQDRAREVLGYEPALDPAASLRDYVRWHRDMYGLSGPFADLFQELA